MQLKHFIWIIALILIISVISVPVKSQLIVTKEMCVSAQNFSNYLGSSATISGGICSLPANSGNSYTVQIGNRTLDKSVITLIWGNLTIDPWQATGAAITTSTKNNSRTDRSWGIADGTTTNYIGFFTSSSTFYDNIATKPINQDLKLVINSTDGYYYFYIAGTLINKYTIETNSTYVLYQTDNPVVKFSNFTVINESAAAGTPSLLIATCSSCNPVQDDTSTPWITDDTTPTINATLDFAGTCAIGDNASISGIESIDYTTLKANGGFDCSTTNSTTQVCTIGTAMSLGNNHKISMACKNYANPTTEGNVFSHPLGIYSFTSSSSIPTSIHVGSGCSYSVIGTRAYII